MPRIAVFPGTFDPFTRAHANITQRAACLFEKLIVAVAADSTGKQAVLPLVTRLQLAKEALINMPNIQVLAFQGLVVHFAQAQKASVLIRGVRVGTEFDYETQMASMNQQLAPEIETVFLAPRPEDRHISATLVRDIARLGGDISGLVNDATASVLKAHYRVT